MNYYLNVSLIGSFTKNDRCQDVTLSNIFQQITKKKYIKRKKNLGGKSPVERPLYIIIRQ